MGWKSGSVIMKAQPFAHVVMQKHKQDRCNFCLKRSDNLKKCGVCTQVWYCGVPCQKKDWKLHKVECKVMKRVPDTPTDSMRLFLRLVLRHLNGASSVLQEKEESPCIRCFDNLMSHSDAIKSDTVRYGLFEVARTFLLAYTHEVISPPSDSVLLEIFGKMVINTFTIVDEDLHDVAVGVYNSPSILDHECQPNAVASFQGRSLTIRAVNDIDSDSYNQVFLSYVDPLATRCERQDQLQKQYYFQCSCPRCTSNRVETLMCSVEGGSEADVTKIQACMKKIDSMQSNEENSPGAASILEICTSCLDEISLPSTNVYLVRLIDKAMDVAIQAQEFEVAARLGQRNIEPYKLLLPATSPSAGQLSANLGKLLLYLGELREAETQLAKALHIFLITLGSNHILTGQVGEMYNQCRAELGAESHQQQLEL